MIPASYLFKGVYHQQWETPEAATVTLERERRFLDGLMTPLGGAIAALLAHRPRHHRQSRRHAYE